MCFFSGGVDAFATLIAHIEESPRLVTIFGADINLNDKEGTDNVLQHVANTGNQFKIEYNCIKTNIKDYLNYTYLNELVKKSNDSWWHGFQHGICLIGTAAPFVHILGIKQIYIASSYTKEDNVPCASHPNIDNKVKFGGCQVLHDQYEYNRQQKIQHILEYTKTDSTVQNIQLRVCWMSRGGHNCSKCEKCYRTIFGLIAEGANPELFGFPNVNNDYNRISHDIKRNLIFHNSIITLWTDIQSRIRYNYARKSVVIPPELEWILDFDFSKINKTPRKQTIIVLKKVKDQLRKLRRIISMNRLTL